MGLRRLLFILLYLLPATLTFAHAAPVRLDPPSGALVAPGPVTLRLGMTQAVELRFSRVSVRGPDRTWNADLRLEGEQTIAADLPALDPGRYDISWRVLSVDGHLTEGSYYVTVAPEGVVAAQQAAAPLDRKLDLGIWAIGLVSALLSAVLVARHLRQSLIRG